MGGRHQRARVVCVGGTFDRLHIAHEMLLLRAIEAAGGAAGGGGGDSGRARAVDKSGGKLIVGVASDEMARRARDGERIQTYYVRAQAVARFLRSRSVRFQIVRLEDRHGPAASGDFDAIAVSEETLPVAREINRLRRARGLRPLRTISLPTVLAEDGLPISSSRIRRGELDRMGRLRRLTVAVGSTNPVKRDAVRAVMRRTLRRRAVEVVGVSVPSGVPEQPFEADVVRGAVQRARAALRARGAHLGVGVEAGLFWSRWLGSYIDIQYCAIVDRGGRVTIGHGPGFQHAPAVVRTALRGGTVGGATAALTGIRNIGRRGGVVGYLSRGALVRRELTETAVVAALLPRLNPELYFFARDRQPSRRRSSSRR